MSFVAKKSADISTSNNLWDIIVPVTVEGKYSSDKIHKVKIKLKPNSGKNPSKTE